MPINPIIIETGKELIKTGVKLKIVEKAVEQTAQLVAVPLILEVGKVSRDLLIKTTATQVGVAIAIQAAPNARGALGNIIQRLGYRGFERGIKAGVQTANDLLAARVKEADIPTLIIMVHDMAMTNPQYSSTLTLFKAGAVAVKYITTIVTAVVVVNMLIVKFTLYQAFMGYVLSARGELTTYLAKGLDYSVYNKALLDLSACKTIEQIQLLMLSMNRLSINT
jgi:hypothetical protein